MARRLYPRNFAEFMLYWFLGWNIGFTWSEILFRFFEKGFR